MSKKQGRRGKIEFSVSGNRFVISIRKNRRVGNSLGLEAWYTNMVTNKLARAVMRIETFDLNSLQVQAPAAE